MKDFGSAGREIIVSLCMCLATATAGLISLAGCQTSEPSSVLANLKAESNQILKELEPVRVRLSKITKDVAPAKNIDELAQQLTSALEDAKLKQAYRVANKNLNSIAVLDEHFGPFDIPNFYEVSSGVYRSAIPQLFQAEKLIEHEVVDNIIALNVEIQDAYKFDPKPANPLSHARRVAIAEKMISEQGNSSIRASRKVDFYQKNLPYALALHDREHPWLELIPTERPAATLPNFFAAVERINALRAKGKRVVFHCSVGKHRAGLLSMMIQVLDNKGRLDQLLEDRLYLEYVKRNWNKKAQTAIEHMIVLPLIVQSEPFQKLAIAWEKARPDEAEL